MPDALEPSFCRTRACSMSMTFARCHKGIELGLRGPALGRLRDRFGATLCEALLPISYPNPGRSLQLEVWQLKWSGRNA